LARLKCQFFKSIGYDYRYLSFFVSLTVLCIFLFNPLHAKQKSIKNKHPAVTRYVSLPKGWKFVDTSILSSIGSSFITTAEAEGTALPIPSLTISTEPVEASLEEYAVQVMPSVNGIHDNAVSLIRAVNLGNMTTLGGQAMISELHLRTTAGEAKSLKAVLVHEQHGYIITTTASSDDFASFFGDFIHIIQSFTPTPNSVYKIATPEVD
jgi:hypothetical protein